MLGVFVRFLYLGQTSMGNRGCEALLRSTTALIRERFPHARFLCPSENMANDARQWPDAAEQGIEFVDVPAFSTQLKIWNRLTGALPMVGFDHPPAYPLNAAYRALLDQCDAVLMTGGDIVSLDYGLFSLYHWTGLVEAAVKAGKPAHLLAASVGPFTKMPDVEKRMRRHLASYRTISVRETPSFDYVRQMGVADAVLVVDPAFTMEAQPWDCAEIFVPGVNYVGLNVSPIVRNVRGSEESKAAFDADIVRFISSILEKTGMNVVLVPHVGPLDGSGENSDRHYMARLLASMPDNSRVRLLPDGLNTVQLKYAIGKCRYFIGARTHATVASLSQLVPTCSIAYSVKALGINRDLLGDTRYVLPTPEVNSATLWSHLEALMEGEADIKALLGQRIPEWKRKARAAIDRVVLK